MLFIAQQLCVPSYCMTATIHVYEQSCNSHSLDKRSIEHNGCISSLLMSISLLSFAMSKLQLCPSLEMNRLCNTLWNLTHKVPGDEEYGEDASYQLLLNKDKVKYWLHTWADGIMV